MLLYVVITSLNLLSNLSVKSKTKQLIFVKITQKRWILLRTFTASNYLKYPCIKINTIYHISDSLTWMRNKYVFCDNILVHFEVLRLRYQITTTIINYVLQNSNTKDNVIILLRRWFITVTHQNILNIITSVRKLM